MAQNEAEWNLEGRNERESQEGGKAYKAIFSSVRDLKWAPSTGLEGLGEARGAERGGGGLRGRGREGGGGERERENYENGPLAKKMTRRKEQED